MSPTSNVAGIMAGHSLGEGGGLVASGATNANACGAYRRGMLMSLVSALDDLMGFVDKYLAVPLRQRQPFDVSRFETLDRAVYVEACHLNLSNHMPRRPPV